MQEKIDDSMEDAEIDKIMSEIEELQQEMNRADAAAAAPVKKLHAVPDSPTSTLGDEDDILKEFQNGGANEDASMDETLGHLKHESSGPSLLDDEAASEPDTSEIEDQIERDKQMVSDDQEMGTGSGGSMTLSMTGNMTLRLNYEVEGQLITIGFAEQTLTVELADGTEFKIPLHRTAKAA